MSDENEDSEKPDPGEQQSDTTAERNKPEEARAKDEPKAGNILGGVQPSSD